GAPAALNASATAGTISCNGSNTTVTVSATGGTQPYTGTGTFTVTAGTYNYTVTDAGGQTATTSITVSQPTLLTLSVSAGTINTYGGTTTITANANGGTAAYTYKLNNGSYQASNVFNNVASGSYTITVKDANGCTQSKSINITEPAAPSALNINVTAGTISCYGSTTTVTVTASGGTAPYSGVGTFTKTAGTYSYTVTDAAGVKATKSITLTQPEVLNASIAVGAIQSYGGTTNLTITATGGTAPYQYSVSASSFQSQNSFSSIKAGSYTVVVKDAKGCTSTKVISVSQPAEQISINTKTKAAGCAGGADGSIEVSVKSGGTGPYTYNINNGSFGNSNSFANLIAGTYKVSVKDSKGLVSSTNVAIADGTRKCKAIYLTAFPNPTTTEFSVNIESDDSKNDVYITVINLLGQKVYSAIGKINQKITFGREFKAGTYILRVKQGSYSETVKLIKFK
ncbi:MAG: T9SS type A sorting domain-containing protein, partial [Bacteroidetes bacterium]|nr:T9SS type A sorting domain-containing protein [Bacteroidota bacterium]